MLDAVTDGLSRTLFGEARGDGPQGMSAVASVILNRATKPGWWGRDVLSCCKAPFQFSCWGALDVNRPKLLAVTDADLSFRCAIAIAQLALAGELADITGGADSYYAINIPPPRWVAGLTPTAVIGHQRFYRVSK